MCVSFWLETLKSFIMYKQLAIGPLCVLWYIFIYILHDSSRGCTGLLITIISRVNWECKYKLIMHVHFKRCSFFFKFFFINFVFFDYSILLYTSIFHIVWFSIGVFNLWNVLQKVIFNFSRNYANFLFVLNRYSFVFCNWYGFLLSCHDIT